MKAATSVFSACILVAVMAVSGCTGNTHTTDAQRANASVDVSDKPLPVTLPDSAVWTMPAKGGEHAYRIFVSIPSQPAPADGYPVLYILDANSTFFSAVAAVRRHAGGPYAGNVPPVVVVGIGYPRGTDVAAALARDLTPATQVDTPRLETTTGGAEAFLAFMQDQLKPAISRAVDVDTQHQTLFGHSLGGLFTLYAMTVQPQGFQNYIAANPALWYADEAMMERLKAFSAEYSRPEGKPPIRVQLTVGEFQGMSAPWAAHQGPEMVHVIDNTAKAMQTLDRSDEIAARYQMIIGEGQYSMLAAAITHAVRFLARDYTMMNATVSAVPGPREYVDMTPEQRYRLRMQVRALPDAARIPWVQQFERALGSSDAPYVKLHKERNRMDRMHGTLPRAE